jgi:hypothetical protein
VSTRAKAKQNLLVATANVAIERHLITLQCEPVVKGTFDFMIGPYPVIGYVSDAGYDEVTLKAIVCPTELGRKHPTIFLCHRDPRFCEASACGYLERRDGKYLQIGARTYQGSKEVTRALAELPVVPLGFGTKPTPGGYDWHNEFARVFGPPRRAVRA